MEAYGASNNGSYAGATASSLNSIEPAINITSNTSDAVRVHRVARLPPTTRSSSTSPMSGGSFTLTKSGNTHHPHVLGHRRRLRGLELVADGDSDDPPHPHLRCLSRSAP